MRYIYFLCILCFLFCTKKSKKFDRDSFESSIKAETKKIKFIKYDSLEIEDSKLTLHFLDSFQFLEDFFMFESAIYSMREQRLQIEKFDSVYVKFRTLSRNEATFYDSGKVFSDRINERYPEEGSLFKKYATKLLLDPTTREEIGLDLGYNLALVNNPGKEEEVLHVDNYLQLLYNYFKVCETMSSDNISHYKIDGIYKNAEAEIDLIGRRELVDFIDSIRHECGELMVEKFIKPNLPEEGSKEDKLQ